MLSHHVLDVVQGSKSATVCDSISHVDAADLWEIGKLPACSACERAKVECIGFDAVSKTNVSRK